MKVRDNSDDVGVVGKIILKCIFCVVMDSNWFRIATRSCRCITERLESIKDGIFIDQL